MLRVRALVELGDEVGEGRVRLGPHEVLGEPHEGREGLPAVADRPRSRGGLGCPALGAEHRTHLGGQVHDVVEQGVVAPEAGGPAQRRPRLAHLRPLEEPLGPAQLIGHPGVGESPFVDRGLGVGAVEDRDLARRHARGDEVADAAGGALGLGGLVPVLRVGGFGAGLALRDQFEAVFGGPAAGVGEDAVGEVHDLGGGAVVPDELDHRRVRVPVAEVQQVIGGGAGEGVDGLAGVADDAQVVAVADPQVEEALLEGADVLVLVDHEVLVLAAHGLRDVVPVLDHADGEQQHVLEVDHAAVALELLVRGVDPADLGGVTGGLATGLGDGGRIVLRHGLGDLGPFDLARDIAQFIAVEADAAARGGLGDELDLALDQPRHVAADGLGPEVLELAQGGRVERTRLDAARAELAQPSAHLARGAVGEGDGEHARGLEYPGPDAVRDAVGDRARLSRAGPGQHAYRAAQGRGHLALLGVEPVEHRVGGVGDLREEGGTRYCCHPAMLPGPLGRP